jgi:glutaredoxin
MILQVRLYGKPGCCLCDECEELLHRLQNEYSFTLEKHNIEDDAVLRESWRCHIPVVTVNYRQRVALRVTEERLRRALNKALSEQTANL